MLPTSVCYILLFCLGFVLGEKGLYEVQNDEIGTKYSSYDLNLQNVIADTEKELDIWDDDNLNLNTAIFDRISDQLITNICQDENYIIYDKTNDRKIHCQSWNEEEHLPANNHLIIKREAEDADEGSGNGLEETEEELKIDENKPVETEQATKAEETKLVDEPKSEDPNSKTENNEHAVLEEREEAPKTEETKPVDQPKPEDPSAITENNEQAVVSAPKKTEEETNKESETDKQDKEVYHKEATSLGIDDTIKGEKIVIADNNDATIDSKPILINPDVLKTQEEKYEDEKNKTNGTVKGKKGRKFVETEDLNEKQSNNAIMETSDDAESERISHDEHLNSEIKEKAGEKSGKIVEDPSLKAKMSEPELQNYNTEAPKSDEVSKAKDSNILLFLFGGVVVVGITALAYNYIKKKNQMQQNNDEEAVTPAKSKENVASPVEMQPLMKNGKPVPDEMKTEHEGNGSEIRESNSTNNQNSDENNEKS